jgi:hypothetical protein
MNPEENNENQNQENQENENQQGEQGGEMEMKMMNYLNIFQQIILIFVDSKIH